MVWTEESWKYFQCSTSHHTTPGHATFHYTTSRHTVLPNTKLTTSYCQWFELRSRESTFSAARHTTPHHTLSRHISLHYVTPHRASQNQTNHIILSMVWTEESWEYFQCCTSHHTLSCHPTLHYATPPNTAIYYTSQHHTAPWCVTAHHIMSRYATTRHATPHSITLLSINSLSYSFSVLVMFLILKS